jgi:hypothetical protein
MRRCGLGTMCDRPGDFGLRLFHGNSFADHHRRDDRGSFYTYFSFRIFVVDIVVMSGDFRFRMWLRMRLRFKPARDRPGGAFVL